MFHACFCKCDAGSKKRSLETRKCPKIKLQEPQNPSKKQLKSDSASEAASEPQFFRNFAILHGLLGSKMEAKSKKKHLKCEALKQHFFESILILIFFALASKNKAKIMFFSYLFRKRRFCKNHAPVEARARFLRFGASKFQTKIDAKTHSKTTLKKTAPDVNFRIHFGLQKPPKSLPKAKVYEAGFATLWKSHGNRRKLTGGSLCKASIWLGI